MTIDNKQLNATETTIVTVPAGKRYAVIMVGFCNVTASDVTITVYIKKSGSIAGDSTTMLKDVVIPAKDTFMFNTEKLLLDEGDSVSALCSVANAVSVLPSFVEM